VRAQTPADVDRTGKPSASAGLPPTLECIRWHESRGDYRAFNGIDHYGAYQLAATYSDTWATRYGYGEWAGLTADLWPRDVQDAVAAELFADWPGAWSTYGACS
jgi:hypothetical protein